MKLHHLVKSTTLALALAVGLGASGARANEEDEDEQKVEMKDLSADVQKTIQDYLAGGNVTRVVKESEDGKTFYSADGQKPHGEKVEIKVAEDGKLVGENTIKQKENDNDD